MSPSDSADHPGTILYQGRNQDLNLAKQKYEIGICQKSHNTVTITVYI